MLTTEQIAAARQANGITPISTTPAGAPDKMKSMTDAWAEADAAAEPYVSRVTKKMKSESAKTGDEFAAGGATVIKDFKTLQDRNKTAASPVDKVLNALVFAGHTAGTIASTAGKVGIDAVKGAIAPVTEMKNADDSSKTIGQTFSEPVHVKAHELMTALTTAHPEVVDFIGKQVDAHPDIARGIGDLVNTIALKGVKGEIPNLKQTATELKTSVQDLVKNTANTAKGTVEKVKTAAGSPEEKLTEAMTPVLTPSKTAKGVMNSAKNGEVFDESAMKSVQNSVTALNDVATSLGKKATDIVKPGIKKAEQNAANIGKTIAEYSQKKVAPFLQKSGVNYNFTDLKKALELVQPSESLEKASVATYNKVRSRILNAIANKVGPETKGIKSVADLRKVAGETGSVPKKELKGDVDFWDARKIIDSIVDEETKGKAWGDAAVIGAKAAYKDMRSGFAQYLSEAFRYPGQMEKLNKANEFLRTKQTTGMDKTGWNLDQFESQFGLKRSPMTEEMAQEWEKYMQNLSSLYDGIANVSTRATKEHGKKWIALFAKEHPTVVRGLQYGLGAVGAGALFNFGQEAL